MTACEDDQFFRFSEQDPDAIAVLVRDSLPLSYGELSRHADYIRECLRQWDLSGGDRVVTVVPLGPEAAVCLLALAGLVTCVPISPALDTEEIEKSLADVGAKAVIAGMGTEVSAKRAAERLGIRFIELTVAPGAAAGVFELKSDQGTVAASNFSSGPAEIVMILASSGTTSKPKLVPLSELVVRSRCEAMRDRFRLAKNDRCLNLLPLCHLGGINCLFASAFSGGSTVCVREFSLSGHLDALIRFEPTYFAASPTTHQAMLDIARENPDNAHSRYNALIRKLVSFERAAARCAT